MNNPIISLFLQNLKETRWLSQNLELETFSGKFSFSRFPSTFWRNLRWKTAYLRRWISMDQEAMARPLRPRGRRHGSPSMPLEATGSRWYRHERAQEQKDHEEEQKGRWSDGPKPERRSLGSIMHDIAFRPDTQTLQLQEPSYFQRRQSDRTCRSWKCLTMPRIIYRYSLHNQFSTQNYKIVKREGRELVVIGNLLLTAQSCKI